MTAHLSPALAERPSARYANGYGVCGFGLVRAPLDAIDELWHPLGPPGGPPFAPAVLKAVIKSRDLR